MKYYSQFGEDEWLQKNGKIKEGGFYVDAGAGHAKLHSNTYLLERWFGWNGLCIDADARNGRAIMEFREALFTPVAVGPKDGEILTMYTAHSPDITTASENPPKGFRGNFKVPAFRLETILGWFDVKKVHLLSIDIEGLESAVLRDFDLKKYGVEIAIVEYKSVAGGNNSAEILEIMTKQGYKRIHATHNNLIFEPA